MFRDRRLYPRLVVDLSAEYLLEGAESWEEGRMVDLSAGGVGLQTEQELAVETVVAKIHFALPDEEEGSEDRIEASARVVRSERQDNPEGKWVYRSGLEFIDLADKDWQVLQRHVLAQMIEQMGTRSKSSAPLNKRRVPVEQPLVLRFARFDKFIEEVSGDISLEGMFIKSEDPRPEGSIFDFRMDLHDDFTLIEGRAEVVWVRSHSQTEAQPNGMGVRFLDLDETGRKVIERLIRQVTED